VHNVHGVVIDMLTTMNKILNIGMPLQEVIYRSTVTPANEIGHPELGNLSVGAEADVAVFKMQQGEFGFMDCGRAKIVGDKKLECMLTVRAGEIVFDPNAITVPKWQDAPANYWIIR
jgi:dihydroorotase